MYFCHISLHHIFLYSDLHKEVRSWTISLFKCWCFVRAGIKSQRLEKIENLKEASTVYCPWPAVVGEAVTLHRCWPSSLRVCVCVLRHMQSLSQTGAAVQQEVLNWVRSRTERAQTSAGWEREEREPKTNLCSRSTKTQKSTDTCVWYWAGPHRPVSFYLFSY